MKNMENKKENKNSIAGELMKKHAALKSEKKITPVQDGIFKKEMDKQTHEAKKKQKKKIKAEINNEFKAPGEKAASKSMAEKLIESNTGDKLIRTSYNTVKHFFNFDTSVEHKKKKIAKSNKKNVPEDSYGYTQDIIPIKTIENGIIQTQSGMYVKILEVLPIDFDNLDIIDKIASPDYFASILKGDITRVRIKCITDKSNPSRLIDFIKAQCQNEKKQRGISKKTLDCAQDLIDKIHYMAEHSSLTTRYFITFRYEGASTRIEDIIFDMDTTQKSITKSLKNAGNYVIDSSYSSATFNQMEILYYFYNRKTCRVESFGERYKRINADLEKYNESSENKKIADIKDYIAPKGIDMTHKEYVIIDGCYKTYLILKSASHPTYAYPNWISNFTGIGDGTEVDIYLEKLPTQLVSSAVGQIAKFSRVSGNNAETNPEKQAKLYNRFYKLKQLKEHLDKGEDLFNTVIIITLSAASAKQLRQLKLIVKKSLVKSGMDCEDTYANGMEFFYATLPLMDMPRKIFNRNKRNYLTSSVETLYPFTSAELFDSDGAVLGENASNKSIVAMNNFNTNMYSNANMSVLGMSGSGKTYSMNILARAMRLSGKRVFAILPMKAYEWQRGCEALGGGYYQIGPGMKNRVNICAILPEQNIDKDILEQTGIKKKSLLASQIAFLITWIELNMDEALTRDEKDLVETELTGLYFDFGITEDNNSIYNPDGSLKIMPVISDMYDRFADFPELKYVNKALKKYVSGSCRNMNGQTNIDLTNKYIIFDVDQQNMTKDLIPPFLFLVMKCVYDLVKQNSLYFDVVFFDEIWTLMMYPAAAEQIIEMARIIRGYGGSIIPITQDVSVYLDSNSGRTMISNTAIKLVMHLEPDEAQKAAKVLNLTKDDVRKIIGFGRGQAMLLTSKKKTCINIVASYKEDYAFTTDPDRRREYTIMEKNGELPWQ